MKIVLFSMHFYPETFRINTVIRSLSESNLCEIKVITGKPNYHDGIIPKEYNNFQIQKEKYYKADITRLPIFPRKKKKYWQIFLNYISFLLNSIVYVLFTHKKYKSDFVLIYATSPILQSIPALLLSKLSNAKSVLWLQDLWPDNLISSKKIKQKPLIYLLKKITKNIYKQSDFILTQSEAFKKNILKLAPDRNNIYFHPNPTEFIKFEYPKFRVRKQKSLNLFLIGNIGEAQSTESIINLLVYLNKLKFNDHITIFGSGSGIQFLRNYTKKNNLNNVSINDHIHPDLLHLEMLKADIFIICLKNGAGLEDTIPARLQTYIFFGKNIISLDHKGEISNFLLSNNIGLSINTYDNKDLNKSFEIIRSQDFDDQKNIYNNCKSLYFKYYEPSVNSKNLLNYFHTFVSK